MEALTAGMHAKRHWRPEALLLISLLLVILLNPVMDHGDWRRLVLSALTFIPVVLSAIKLTELKIWVWPSLVLMLASLVFVIASDLFHNRLLLGIRWAFLAAFFGLAAVGLFSYLKNSPTIRQAHLYTAVSIYLLLGMVWACLYTAIDILSPGAIQLGSNPTDRQSAMLYFSLVTLSTIGYGDVVPISGEARMLAALEGLTGVLYVAITVAILVSAFKRDASE